MSKKALVLRHDFDMFPITLVLAMNQAGIDKLTGAIEMPGPNWAATYRVSHEDGEYVLVAASKSVASDDILTHEAVHVWQILCKFLGENSPGIEMEAYHIQHISEWLKDMRNQLTGKRK